MFHDHNGSYTEATERPIHCTIIDELWHSLVSYGVKYPYLHAWPNLVLDPMFESRVDAMLNPHERVAILLGLLEHSKWIMERKHVTSPNIHLLARKPDLCNKDTPHGSPKDYTPTRRQLTHEAEFLLLSLTTLRPCGWTRHWQGS